MSFRKPFTCCKKRVPVAALNRFLTREFTERYSGMLLELDTANPTYCSKRMCSAFIPPASIKGNQATCPKCAFVTCRLCKKADHADICNEDETGRQLISLAESKKWQACPHCKIIVDKIDGCLHMSCRCGTEFCYNCGKSSSLCSGTCARRR